MQCKQQGHNSVDYKQTVITTVLTQLLDILPPRPLQPLWQKLSVFDIVAKPQTASCNSSLASSASRVTCKLLMRRELALTTLNWKLSIVTSSPRSGR